MSKPLINYLPFGDELQMLFPLKSLPPKDTVRLFTRLCDKLGITEALTSDPHCQEAIQRIDECLMAYVEDERP